MTDARTSRAIPPSRWTWAAGHDRGGRSEDQDNCAVPITGDPRVATHGALLVLCDGGGGGDRGEIASQTAVAVAMERYYAADARLPRRQALLEMTAEAHAEVCRRAQADAALGNMATTLVAALITPSGQVYTAHAGDSRAYQLLNGRLEPLTHDHRLVWGQRHRGAADSSLKRVLTKSLGPGGDAIPDIQLLGSLKPGARIVLCSDGVHGAVAEDEIQQIAQQAPTAADAQRALLDAALRNGTADSISAIVFDYGRPAGLLAHPVTRRAAMPAAAVAALGIIALAVGVARGRSGPAQPAGEVATPPQAAASAAPPVTASVAAAWSPAPGGDAAPAQGEPAATAAPTVGAISPPTATLNADAPSATPIPVPSKTPAAPATLRPVATGLPAATKVAYPAPQPLRPDPNQRFEPHEMPDLSWKAVGPLQPDDYYRVLIKHRRGDDVMCVKDTSAKPNPYVRTEGAADDTFLWTVDVVRAETPPEAGSRFCRGTVVSAGASQPSSFKWARETPQPNNLPAPSACLPGPGVKCPTP